jgi:hypothetical protein
MSESIVFTLVPPALRFGVLKLRFGVLRSRTQRMGLRFGVAFWTCVLAAFWGVLETCLTLFLRFELRFESFGLQTGSVAIWAFCVAFWICVLDLRFGLDGRQSHTFLAFWTCVLAP